MAAADLTMSADTPPDGAFEALAAFRLELRRYLAFAQEAADARGVTMAQHQAMLAIRAAPEQALSIGALAETLLVRHHSAVEMVQRLEAAGYMRRTPDPQDGRKAIIGLTAKGEALVEDLARLHLAQLNSAGPELGRALRRVSGI